MHASASEIILILAFSGFLKHISLTYRAMGIGHVLALELPLGSWCVTATARWRGPQWRAQVCRRDAWRLHQTFQLSSTFQSF